MAVAGGMVYLVGAGPGDPGLVTARALACIRTADVLVYDRLVSPALVAQARPGAELIYVGKASGHHGRKQADINGLLADRALEGQAVCRLKGGDPFVFGRGGEEAELLRALGVRYEVVPGITAGIAAAAYAGIPVTHRDFAGAVTLVTGHDAPCKRGPAVDWERLAGAGGTLLIYMGVEALAGTARRLVRGGRDSETPVAVIRWGTRAEQQVVTGTLDTIADAVRRAGVESPAMIVVGEVVGLAERLGWVAAKPLFGRRVLLPTLGGVAAQAGGAAAQAGGAAAQAGTAGAGDWAQQLREAGAEVWEWPVAMSVSLPAPAQLDALDRYDCLLLAGSHSVPQFLQRLIEAGRDVRALYRLRVGALDAPTAAALAGVGLRADFTGLHEGAALAELAGHRVLVAGEAGAAGDVAAELRRVGALADVALTHALRPRTELAPLLREALQAGEIADVLLPDPGLLPLLVELLGDPDLLAGVRIADDPAAVLAAAQPALR